MGEIITVKSIESKVSRNNKPFIRVQDARNRWLTKWGNDAPTVGQVFLAEIRTEERDGLTFRTIDSWQPHQAGTASNGQMAEVGKAVMGTLDNIRDRRIMAECALRAAVDAARVWPAKDNYHETVTDILETANTFLTWLLANDGTRATDEPF